jgi:LuxR family transcriptional regulator
MNKWQAHLIDSLLDVGSPDQIQARIAWAATELGFDHYTYGCWLPLPLSNPSLELIGNAPQDWQRRYRQQRHAGHDPVVAHARRSMEPLVWDEAVFAAHPALARDVREHGCCVGWTQASIDAQGRRGLLTLARRTPAVSPAERQQKAQNIRWLAYMAHLFLDNEAVKRQEMPQAAATGLTDREAEVLRWTGDGKTTGEISSILAISNNTVNYHLKNATAKLQAANKTSAVVIALTRGMLAY